ncbi:MAG TPA: HAD family hydrolase [Roseiarcus sp.]|nr:HAD family hydrolase [Roseiarcus sp.]
MDIICLATDYDGTLAHDGVVGEPTIEALNDFKLSGRKLILVTGREMPDLARCFPRLDLFDRVVAENGALILNPATKEERPLAPEPPQAFVEALRSKKVHPLSVGRSIVATWEPNEAAVLEAIRELGLELQIVFNKGAVMVLPAGVNKASGLAAALDELGLSPHNVVGIGDAENDHAFMQASRYAVAVANALPSVKDEADLVTKGARGEGVTELIRGILERDVDAFESARNRNAVEVGRRLDGRAVALNPHGGGALIAGLSSGGKSTLATALLERFVGRGFQVCVFDPEGDYADFHSAVVLGDAKAPPHLSEVPKVLERPNDSVVINMLAVSVGDRPAVFARFLSAIVELRARVGRPHWILVDEAHHVLPAKRDPSVTALPPTLPATIFVTVDPEAIARAALERVDDVFAVGTRPAETIAAFCHGIAAETPPLPSKALPRGQALFWSKGRNEPPEVVTLHPPAEKSERHKRKYAVGELGEDRSFYFRGPSNALNLRAQNLMIFLQIADGVDDETWLHHLKAHDVSRWLKDSIKDDELAEEVRKVEEETDPSLTRKRVREAVERRYTAPADAADGGRSG